LLNIPDFAFRRWASSTIRPAKVLAGVAVKEPEPTKRLEMRVFFRVPVSLFS
jgi:hypothetical protein